MYNQAIPLLNTKGLSLPAVGKYPLLLLTPVDVEGDRTDLSGLYLTSENTLQNMMCFSVQGEESASRPRWSSFVHLKTPRNLCPPQQHVGGSKAASLLLETLPMRNTSWSWSTFCSRHYYECPCLNTLIILSNNFFEAREGVRLLMALKHFLKEA